MLDELGLAPLAGRPLKKLSGGQRRLACFAAALVGERPLLVLDEPTTGMDPVARRAVWAAVDRRRAERGATVLLVTHNVIEAETVLDRVAVLDQGRVIACDTPAGLKEQVAGEVRVELVWRERAPLEVPEVAALRDRAVESGRRWTLRLAPEEARAAVATVTGGAAFAALDDFTPRHAQPGGRLPGARRGRPAGAGEGMSTRPRRIRIGPRVGTAALAAVGEEEQRDVSVVPAEVLPGSARSRGRSTARGARPSSGRARGCGRRWPPSTGRSCPGPGSRASRCCSWRPSSRSGSWS